MKMGPYRNVAPVEAEAGQPAAESPSPGQSVGNDIAQLAYARFEARGKVDGFDVEDWLAAEEEVRLRSATIPDTAAASITESGQSASSERSADGSLVLDVAS
jgi:hypothetical protein